MQGISIFGFSDEARALLRPFMVATYFGMHVGVVLMPAESSIFEAHSLARVHRPCRVRVDLLFANVQG
jgi:hypothetical protein